MGLRIHLHDNSGHAFPVQLSRALAALGHAVRHTYMASFQSPKGQLTRQPGDPAQLQIEGLSLGSPFPKYSYWQRWRYERRFGALLAAQIAQQRPDVLLVCNTPLDVLEILQRTCKRHGIRLVFWVQDLYGYAVAKILGQKYGMAGRFLGRYYERKERRLLAASDHAIAITEDFRPFLREAGLADDRVTILPNWAPIEDFPRRDKRNSWSVAHGLADRFVFLYSGTLGLKHDPGLLLALARRFRERPEVRVVVVTEGIGADWLRDAMAVEPLDNLLLLPYQPFEAMPDVLASANVLVAVLEQSAGVFSVPSKVLSYLCAGRPVLLAAPAENQAAQLVVESGAGRVSAAGDGEAFLAVAEGLLAEPDLLRQMGDAARHAAEYRFGIESIAGRFEALLAGTT